jgi:hypothetical protein
MTLWFAAPTPETEAMLAAGVSAAARRRIRPPLTATSDGPVAGRDASHLEGDTT